MKFIAHRGNTFGRSIELENSPKYIQKALSEGYDVEIDVWYVDGKFYLGHDHPQYEVGSAILMDGRMWCHAKNAEAFAEMQNISNIHCFWHQEDDYTLTSRGIVWTYPNKKIIKNSVIVLKDADKLPNGYELRNCLVGICSNFVSTLETEIDAKFSK